MMAEHVAFVIAMAFAVWLGTGLVAAPVFVIICIGMASAVFLGLALAAIPGNGQGDMESP